ncbi:Dehydrosqualene desaturase [Corynebacterium ciconiae DSM 44920]|uniref:phytoene desaturase family protein n=1 Tax=Corynebacterium ciconiae TaxID=227319 RepID=UPI00035FB05F|nr:phytoene desaturase family protein [Corynebacterium ciconiae]WKD60681.1 Dehydrosqualene desaturase [Corynebacterium ciconiae DSM 44920]
MYPSRVLVIGAGVAGLATAALLARSGIQVEVVEKNSEVGGRAGLLEEGGYRWDTGPSWYLMPDAFDHFFELMGTSTAEQLDLRLLDPSYRVFVDPHKPLDVPAGRAAVVELCESLEPGAGAVVNEYLDQAADVYDIAVQRFLYTTFSSPLPLLHPSVLRRLGTLAGLLGTSLDKHVRRRVSDPRLHHILSYPAVFLSSRPERTPALYHLMSHTDLSQGVRYPMGGFAAVIDALYRLARAEGVRFHLGTRVTAITHDGSRATGLRVLDAQGRAATLTADAVVSGADLHHTETTLLPERLRSYSERYFSRRDPGIGTVLVLAGIDGPLEQLSHHNLFFSADWTPDFDAVFSGPHPQRPLGASESIYVSRPSATDPGVAPEGKENLFLLVPTPADISLGHGDAYGCSPSPEVQAIAQAALAQVGAAIAEPSLPARAEVVRTIGPADFSQRYHAWRGGAIGPAHTLRQSAFLRGSNASSTLDGLYYAGATTVPGVGVPMCLISAENVLKRMRGDRSGGPLGAL